jgi:hypothetical protein
MKPIFVIIFLFVWLGLVAQAPKTYNDSIFLSLKNCENAYCNKDTVKAIQLLEDFEKAYPYSYNTQLTNKILIDLYIATNRTAEAKQKILYTLSYEPTDNSIFDMFTCNTKNNFGRGAIKANMCVALSSLYKHEKKFDSAIYYLSLAENPNKYHPYGIGCVNGYLIYNTYLSPYYADVYIAAGDTIKAINRLLNHLFVGEDGSNGAIKTTLKKILLYKYTQQQITNEIQKGINNLKIIKNKKNESKTVHLTMFNHKIKIYYGYYITNREQIIKNYSHIKLLCEQEAL